MSIELSASMMCADYACLKNEITQLEEAGIDIFHIDIMDGSFVDNFGMGYQDMEYIKKTHLSGEFSDLLISQLENLLNSLPEQKEKDIVITDKNEAVSEDGTLPIKTITITYEPFIDHINASFNEASKLKRISNLNKEKEENPVKKVEVKQFRGESKPRPKLKKVEAVDSEGWKVVKGKK